MKTSWMIAGGLGAGALAVRYALQRQHRTDLRGQVALITGGSRGLGLALAREFGGQGCKLAICARDEEELQRAASLLRSEGNNVFAVSCDVADAELVSRMIRRVEEHYGRIDILVNNAGEILVAPTENTTVADFERAMDVMFWGVVLPTLTLLSSMKKRRSGRIVTITSIGGKVSVPHLTAYTCAKAAAVAFCEGLHAEMAQHGVRVVTVAPGLMRTGSHVNARFKGDYAGEARWFGAAASLPFVSMSAEEAARQAVAAARDGTAVKILSTKTTALARIQGAFPGLVPSLFAVVNRLLPSASSDSKTVVGGRQLQEEQGRIFRAITALGRSAGAHLNQPV